MAEGPGQEKEESSEAIAGPAAAPRDGLRGLIWPRWLIDHLIVGAVIVLAFGFVLCLVVLSPPY